MVDAERHGAQRRPALGAKLPEDLGPDRIVRHHIATVSVPNPCTEPDPDDSHPVLGNAGFQAAISVPIQLHGGPIGSLNLYWATPRDWDDMEREGLDAATAYERLRAAARSSSRKVVHLAREVLRSGPPAPGGF
jgi:GAF domain-containing protein